jgi:hypothetical protein
MEIKETRKGRKVERKEGRNYSSRRRIVAGSISCGEICQGAANSVFPHYYNFAYLLLLKINRNA